MFVGLQAKYSVRLHATEGLKRYNETRTIQRIDTGRCRAVNDDGEVKWSRAIAVMTEPRGCGAPLISAIPQAAIHRKSDSAFFVDFMRTLLHCARP